MKDTPDPASLGVQLKSNNWFAICMFIFGIGVTWGVMKTQYIQQANDISSCKIDIRQLQNNDKTQDLKIMKINTTLHIPDGAADDIKGVSTSSAKLKGGDKT